MIGNATTSSGTMLEEMVDCKPYTIIVVDDEQSIRTLMFDLLSRYGYNVIVAAGPRQALDLVEQVRPAMVISDIQMPDMDGFELLGIVEDRFPEVKRILITGYEVDSYMDMIRSHNVGNILTKGVDFSLDTIGRYVGSLLSGQIFGLDRHFPLEDIRSLTIQTSAQAREACSAIAAQYQAPDQVLFQIAVDELISNAIFHGVLQWTNVSRDLWRDDYVLEPDMAVRVCWARDADRIGVSVEDRNGRLRKNDVLGWLDQRIGTQVNENEHGRGLFLVRKLIDNFIINIDPGKKTECIIVQNIDRNKKLTSKPLLVHEL